MLRRSQIGFGLALLAALAWSASSPGIKYLLDTYHIPNLTLAFWRDLMMAVTCLIILGVFRPDLLRVNRAELRTYAGIGAVAIGLHHALLVFSIALNGAAVAVVLIYTFPTFVTLGAWLFFGERPRPIQLVALVVSLAGCVLLARAYDPALLRVNWFGLLVGIGTGLAHAVYVLFSQHSMLSRSPWTSLTYTMVFGSLALLAMALIANPADVLAVGSTPEPWLMLLALGLGSTLAGYALFTLSLRYLSGSIASLVAVAEAPSGALLAIVLLGEQLELLQVLGIALIIGAMIAPQLAQRSTAGDQRLSTSETVLATTD